jgi:hypothetical protein
VDAVQLTDMVHLDVLLGKGHCAATAAAAGQITTQRFLLSEGISYTCNAAFTSRYTEAMPQPLHHIKHSQSVQILYNS